MVEEEVEHESVTNVKQPGSGSILKKKKKNKNKNKTKKKKRVPPPFSKNFCTSVARQFDDKFVHFYFDTHFIQQPSIARAGAGVGRRSPALDGRYIFSWILSLALVTLGVYFLGEDVHVR